MKKPVRQFGREIKANDVWIDWRGTPDVYYLIKSLGNGFTMILDIDERRALAYRCGNMHEDEPELRFREDIST